LNLRGRQPPGFLTRGALSLQCWIRWRTHGLALPGNGAENHALMTVTATLRCPDFCSREV
jgi:hypothetical protein